MGFPTSHPPRFYAAPNFLKMGIKMPRFVVFWTTSTIKDGKSAAKFHYIKTVSGKVVAQSLPFEWYQYIGRGTTPSPLNLSSKWLALSCQWYPMGDVRTHNSRTHNRRIFKLGGGVDHVTRHVWPLTKVKRSRNVSAAIKLELGNGWSYQLQTWWKLSPRGAHHVTHFLGQ